MPITIGQKADHSFSEPIGLLSDCHRRIESFLSVLMRLAAHSGLPLTTDEQRALESALRYFRDSAPKHTADEEGSLFPRLREFAAASPAVAGAMEKMERLESEHRLAEPLHAEVDALGAAWLTRESLDPEQAARFSELTSKLMALYRNHIRFEDEQIFPLALRVLPADTLAEVGREMADRRSARAVNVK